MGDFTGGTTAREIGSGLWNVHVCSGLSLATELTTDLERASLAARSFFNDWKLNRKLDRLNGFVAELIASFDRSCMREQGAPLQISLESEYGPGVNLIFRLHSVCAALLTSQYQKANSTLEPEKLSRLQLLSNRLFDIFDLLLRLKAQREMDRDARLAADMAESASEEALAWDAAQWAAPHERIPSFAEFSSEFHPSKN